MEAQKILPISGLSQRDIAGMPAISGLSHRDIAGMPARPTIIADSRELQSNVTRFLRELGADVVEKQLATGDYICSDRVCVERKTIDDFINSLIDQRVFRQVHGLSEAYERPVLIMEGNPELLYVERNVHANAIRGALASLTIDYQLPTLWTRNSKETAAQIYWIAYREQVKEKRELQLQIRSVKKSMPTHRQQEALVAGLPGISGKRARQLLEHYRTPERFFRATEGSLKRLDGFGDKRAKAIKEILKAEYKKD
ncbi:MAG: hypothetical protein HY518_03005 [Candidatus Aenigmarchaeota archaeon]|nr:hypothetical protein [Candidatus Aenigmarchaeota archaeon]